MRQAALAGGQTSGTLVRPSAITSSLYLQIGDQCVPQTAAAAQLALQPAVSNSAMQEGAALDLPDGTCNDEDAEEYEENDLLEQQPPPHEQQQQQQQQQLKENNGGNAWHAGDAVVDSSDANANSSTQNDSDANEELADERDEPDFQDEEDGHMIIHRGQIIAHKCMRR